MKMTIEDYAHVRDACKAVRDAQPTITPELYEQKGIGEDPRKRFRWDLLHASQFDVCSLYHYLNDTHIDTAMRRIVSSLYR